MERYRLSILGVLVSTVGALASFLAPPVAVVVSFVGVPLAAFGGFGINVPLTRLAAVVACGMHALAIWNYTQSPWLAAAVMPISLALPPRPWMVRRIGYRSVFVIPGSGAALLALSLGAWPPELMWWVVAPTALFTAHVSRLGINANRRLGKQARDSWHLQVGDEVPEIDVETRGGGHFSLAAHRGTFVFVHFMRGDWCPFCQVMFRVLRETAPRLKEHNTVVLVISHNSGPKADALVKHLGLDYAITSDPDNALAKRFGTFDPSAFDGKGASLPAAFLIDPEGRLLHTSRPDDPQIFLDPEEVLSIVQRASIGPSPA